MLAPGVEADRWKIGIGGDSVKTQTQSKDFKVYLGDGAYADFDGYTVILTTENGVSTTNMIYLEPEVLSAFMRYIAALQERLRESK